MKTWEELPYVNGEDGREWKNCMARYGHTGCPGFQYDDVCLEPWECAAKGKCRISYEKAREINTSEGYISLLKRTFTGFEEDLGQMVLVWDREGKYLGQWQDDMLGDASRIFIRAAPEAPVKDLTKEQMRRIADV